MIAGGTLIDGRYETLQRVGSGGMADVYLCEDRLLGRKVAVKVLHHRFAEDQEFVERFRREASSAAGLSHPNVVAVFDRGEWDGTYYIAMEYLPGRTLKEIVRGGGPLPAAAAIDVVLQICRAARFAHRRGVIHRDLKPHNVILDEEGRAKVTDFGIARAGASDMTLTGSIMGTAQYLSPEQAQGHAVTAGSDLYAVGVVLYELLVGRVPFDGETAVTIALQHISSMAAPPSAANPAVPAELDAIVMRALAKDPAARYGSAEDLIADLEAVRAKLPEPPAEHVLAAGPGALAALAPGVAGLGAIADAAARGGGGQPAVTPLSDAFAPPPPANLNGGHDPSGHSTGSLIAVGRAPGGGRDGEQGNGDTGGRQRARSRWRRRAVRWGAPLLVAVALLALALLLPSETVTVPDVTGRTQAAATEMLKKAELKVLTAEGTSNRPKGSVVSETPNAGTAVKRHSTVTIVVSAGRGSARVPEVAGLSVEEALARLHYVGLRPKKSERSSGTFKAGVAMGTDPAEGKLLESSSEVIVFVSTGPPRVKVPDVRGDSQAQAEALLQDAELAVGAIHRRYSRAAAPGTVIDQEPGPGAKRGPGSTVRLTIARSGAHENAAAQTVSVPSVLYDSQQAAAQALRSASLTPQVISETVLDESHVGVVVKQRPVAGSTAKRHSAVEIFVGAAKSASTTTTSTMTSSAQSTSPTTSTTTTSAAPPGR